MAGLLAFAGFFALVAWYGYGVLSLSIDVGARSMSRLATPVAVTQALWLGGLVVFLFIALVLLVRALAALAVGDIVTAQRLIGSRTAAQELEDELREIEDARAAAGPERAP